MTETQKEIMNSLMADGDTGKREGEKVRKWETNIICGKRGLLNLQDATAQRGK